MKKATLIIFIVFTIMTLFLIGCPNETTRNNNNKTIISDDSSSASNNNGDSSSSSSDDSDSSSSDSSSSGSGETIIEMPIAMVGKWKLTDTNQGFEFKEDYSVYEWNDESSQKSGRIIKCTDSEITMILREGDVTGGEFTWMYRLSSDTLVLTRNDIIMIFTKQMVDSGSNSTNEMAIEMPIAMVGKWKLTDTNQGFEFKEDYSVYEWSDDYSQKSGQIIKCDDNEITMILREGDVTGGEFTWMYRLSSDTLVLTRNDVIMIFTRE